MYLSNIVYGSNFTKYDTMRDAILTCARKPAWVSLIYRTEPTTKKCKTEKLKSKRWNMKTALGNCYGLKLSNCWLQLKNKFIVLLIIIFGAFLINPYWKFLAISCLADYISGTCSGVCGGLYAPYFTAFVHVISRCFSWLACLCLYSVSSLGKCKWKILTV